MWIWNSSNLIRVTTRRLRNSLYAYIFSSKAKTKQKICNAKVWAPESQPNATQHPKNKQKRQTDIDTFPSVDWSCCRKNENVPRGNGCRTSSSFFFSFPSPVLISCWHTFHGFCLTVFQNHILTWSKLFLTPVQWQQLRATVWKLLSFPGHVGTCEICHVWISNAVLGYNNTWRTHIGTNTFSWLGVTPTAGTPGSHIFVKCNKLLQSSREREKNKKKT